MGPQGILIRSDRRPGDDALIVDLHRQGYALEGARFGPSFWTFVGETVAEAQLDIPGHGQVWFAERDGEALGCAAMVARGDLGQLRWVVLRPEARGLGLGKLLVRRAIDYAAERGFHEVFLETTDGLDASMGIYRAFGFRQTSEYLDDLWHGRGQHIIMNLTIF